MLAPKSPIRVDEGGLAMFATMAALLLNSATPLPAADLVATELPQLFQAACLDGQAKLSPGSASPVGFDGLPAKLKRALGTPASGQVWRLNTQGSAYLYILNYPAGPESSPRVCGIASDLMNSQAAQDTIEMRVNGRLSGEHNPSMEWLSPHEGYRALVTRNGKFRVMQVDMLSDAQRDQAMKVYTQLSH
jgi:hypothetical protein